VNKWAMWSVNLLDKVDTMKLDIGQSRGVDNLANLG